MSIARKQYTPDEIKLILKLSDEGWTYKDIGERVRPGVKSAWRSVGDIVRRERDRKIAPPSSEDPNNKPLTHNTSLFAPSQGISKVSLPDGMEDSLTAREFFSILDDDQREIFVATYEDLRGEADEEQLTKAENEMLIRAAFSNVKYLNAQYMLHKCESYLRMELDGQLTDSAEDMAKKRLAGRSDAYKKEIEQWQKEYLEYISNLKLTRKQRLEKIKDTRNTLLDLQLELAEKDRQNSLVEEIKRINLATKEEFYKMARGEPGPDGEIHPWIIGAFEEEIAEGEEIYKENHPEEFENENKETE